MNFKIKILAVLAFSLVPAFMVGQESINRIYTDATMFPLYGKAIENTSGIYERLPQSFEGSKNGNLWWHSHHSAGISIRFRSNSPSISLRWTSSGVYHMNHMTDTGVRGMDLYARDPVDGHWRFARSARPVDDTLNDQIVISDMEPDMREYIVYLSLYEGVKKLEIGIEEGYIIDAPALDSPRKGSPIVMYGSSILQGGCASRPGMAYTNIISRELDREVVNLGFSGAARLDLEMAEMMAGVKDPALFVLDNVPNSWASLIDERQEKFFRIIRDAHPDVPVVFIENPNYPHAVFDKSAAADIAARNASLRAVYEKLKKSGEKRIYYIKGDKMLGADGEATVDGVHFTDLGMFRYAEYVLPTLKKALRKQ